MKILVVSGYGYWGNFDPAALYNESESDVQIAGGETAMLHISKELAHLGHEVMVFYDILRPGRIEGVDFLPSNLFIPLACQLDYDVLISWDAPHIFRFADRAKARIQVFQLNSASIGVLDWMIDLYFHPSEWHKDRFQEIYPEITEAKQRARITNGIDYDRYTKHQADIKKEARVIYSSSPDRGLHHLLEMWPEIVKEVPHAELHVFYDMDKWLKSDRELRRKGLHTVTSDRAASIRKSLRRLPSSVKIHGGIGQHRLAREQLAGSVLAYPCDPVNPTEGFSMTILEGITAGLRVITTDADALAELWGKVPNVTQLPLPVVYSDWTAAIVKALRQEPLEVGQYNPALAWRSIAERWEVELLACLSPS